MSLINWTLRSHRVRAAVVAAGVLAMSGCGEEGGAGIAEAPDASASASGDAAKAPAGNKTATKGQQPSSVE